MVNHENTVCSNCGSNRTSGGWLKTYNKDGSWYPEKKYHCSMCHRYFNPNTGKFSRYSKSSDASKRLKLSFLDTDNIQLKKRKIGRHEHTVCSRCGSMTTSSSGWYYEYDEDGNWDGKSYICNACYQNSAYRSRELDCNSNTYKGIIGERTIAKFIGYNNCILMQQGSLFDISTKRCIDNKYGKIEVKSCLYHPTYRSWTAGEVKPGLFDTLFIICTDSKFENVVRIYIIPGYRTSTSCITIIENPSRSGWYEEFRVDNIVLYQEAFLAVKCEDQLSKNYVSDNQSFMSAKEKGDIGEKVIKEAVGTKASTDIKHDLVHEEYRRIEVKTSSYNIRHKYWVASGIESLKFDTLFIVCMSSDFGRVERIYIIPGECIYSIRTITIYKDLSRSDRYENFRVNEKLYQEVYKKF